MDRYSSTALIRGPEDFLPPITELVFDLISGDLERIVSQGCVNIEPLTNIINNERRFRGEAQESSPGQRGLYWLILPPDSEIISAVASSHCISFGDAGRFFRTREGSFDIANDDNITLDRVVDGTTALPVQSTWKIELPMWTEQGESSLTLRLSAVIEKNRIQLLIEDLEIM